MDGLSTSMLVAAIGVAFVHTALGPDHYLPFVALAKARRWSLRRTLWITTACGIGHVLSSLLLGGLGIAAGIAVGALETVENQRGAMAAWLLFGVGIAYALWGVRQALRHVHAHGHSHGSGDHHHGHGQVPVAARSTTFWALFVVFVLGPCEPLIPLFMVPASQQRWGAALATGVVFGVVTLATMLAITASAVLGLARLPLDPLQRWTHALAGSVIASSAAAVLWLGA